MFIVDRHLSMQLLLILQQLNEAAAVTVSCFGDEDMELLDLT